MMFSEKMVEWRSNGTLGLIQRDHFFEIPLPAILLLSRSRNKTHNIFCCQHCQILHHIFDNRYWRQELNKSIFALPYFQCWQISNSTSYQVANSMGRNFRNFNIMFAALRCMLKLYLIVSQLFEVKLYCHVVGIIKLEITAWTLLDLEPGLWRGNIISVSIKKKKRKYILRNTAKHHTA